MEVLLFIIGVVAVGALALDALRKARWSDMPIKFDRPAECERCRGITIHQFTVYKDVEYHRCTRCGLHTEWEPGGKRKLVLKKTDLPDTTKAEFDFKRTNPRKYKPRKKKGGDDNQKQEE